ncbi:MAG: hypothetical protein A2381_19170 [Bdellovibrionales bacterium RIFOXYB1_FULL_37_110]|nr:MAG: hypothetical protein A2181_09440 [Bdellovibrionales bacterium RIFOXYA1_FULL_38_20]OFZ49499.1 MAG: hypothetical protein A2417_04320 [Bdellovibrionales bacterium RIFOXYC1_FULL_37_79]OFZ58653.1 MAG: hypothetical protein A2381_19170 [Bdellovibrionales bacterium RIFOXYB1_FULL_37_110]OFZ63014.1 MAG: hypothetical protein A2577_05365 [Bdellovibrionales bacterium RIFOXYD1_FULL_36_51]
MGQPQKQKITRKIIFIGKDLACYQNIKDRFQEMYPLELFVFGEMFENDKNQLLRLIPRILSESPQVVFIDYSIHRKELPELARFLRNDIAGKKILTIGLLENIEAKTMLLKSVGRGVFLNFVKGSETINIIHHTMAIIGPEMASDVEFSLAKTSEELVSKTLFRLIFLTPKYIHFESNFNYLKGTTIRIISDLKLNPDLSFNYIVAGEYDYDLKHYYQKAYDFKFDHMDSTEIDLVAKKIDEIETKLASNPKDSKLQYDLNERNNELMQVLEKANEEALNRPVALNKWLEDFKDKTLAHKTQVLIIDKKMNYLSNASEDLFNLNFKLHIQSDFDDKTDIIHRLRPSIIMVGMDDVSEDQVQTPKSPDDDQVAPKPPDQKLCQLHFLITRIKQEKSYQPFFFVFNYDQNGDELKQKLNYPSVLISSKPLELAYLKKSVSLFEAKQGGAVTHRGAGDRPSHELRVYLDESNPCSNLFYQVPIQITMLSETDMVFNSDVEIPLYTCLFTHGPVEMTITVVPFKTKSKRTAADGKYYGLIGGQGEIETSNLRKFVNDLIFEDEKKL